MNLHPEAEAVFDLIRRLQIDPPPLVMCYPNGRKFDPPWTLGWRPEVFECVTAPAFEVVPEYLIEAIRLAECFAAACEGRPNAYTVRTDVLLNQLRLAGRVAFADPGPMKTTPFGRADEFGDILALQIGERHALIGVPPSEFSTDCYFGLVGRACWYDTNGDQDNDRVGWFRRAGAGVVWERGPAFRFDGVFTRGVELVAAPETTAAVGRESRQRPPFMSGQPLTPPELRALEGLRNAPNGLTGIDLATAMGINSSSRGNAVIKSLIAKGLAIRPSPRRRATITDAGLEAARTGTETALNRQ